MELLTTHMEERLAARVRLLAERHQLSHAIILTGHRDLPAAARYLAAAMECTGDHPPCGTCSPCRKVLSGIHPDVMVVEDPEHKMISVDVLRQVRSDAYILPNEGLRKVYIFPDCALLDAKAQNVVLKVVEEGPPHAAFLFCASNSAVLLQTLRSRCVEWNLGDESEALSSADGGQAEALCALLDRRDTMGLAAFFTALETGKVKREELQELLEHAWELTAQSLLAASGCGGRNFCPHLSRQQLSAAADLLKEFSGQLRFNLGVGHVTGALAVLLGDLARQQDPVYH